MATSHVHVIAHARVDVFTTIFKPSCSNQESDLNVFGLFFPYRPWSWKRKRR